MARRRGTFCRKHCINCYGPPAVLVRAVLHTQRALACASMITRKTFLDIVVAPEISRGVITLQAPRLGMRDAEIPFSGPNSARMLRRKVLVNASLASKQCMDRRARGGISTGWAGNRTNRKLRTHRGRPRKPKPSRRIARHSPWSHSG